MFELPDLPYDHAALEPVISKETMHLHHDKHHKRYVDVANQILSEKGDKPASLEQVVRESAGKAETRKLFNNAAQIWNHSFFWACMSPAKSQPAGDLALPEPDAKVTLRPRGGLPMKRVRRADPPKKS